MMGIRCVTGPVLLVAVVVLSVAVSVPVSGATVITSLEMAEIVGGCNRYCWKATNCSAFYDNCGTGCPVSTPCTGTTGGSNLYMRICDGPGQQQWKNCRISEVWIGGCGTQYTGDQCVTTTGGCKCGGNIIDGDPAVYFFVDLTNSDEC